MKNGMDADIASMSQAEKTMLRYQYVMANSTNAMSDFSRTADTWANSVRVLKQTLQQLGGTLGKAFVNLLKPAVQGLTRFFNTLISLVEKAVNAIGKLLGWQIRIDPVGAQFEEDAEGAAGALDDAAGGAGGTAKGLDDAADAAKKLNKQLMAYDEINNIKLPDEDEDTSGSGSPGGGGGGGGASGGGAGEGGAATGGQVRWEKYVSDISSWWQLGREIGEHLTKALESIDWNSIYRRAELFGINLATFLNGLISPDLFSALGGTIAGALNTALVSLDSFGQWFNWTGFGRSLAAGLNRFFTDFKFDQLGSALSTWANGLLIALIKFLRDVDWLQVGQKIGEFLANIDWAEIAKNAAVALYEAINAALDTWVGMLSVAPLETALMTLGGIALFSKTSPVKKLSKWFKDTETSATNFFKLVGEASKDSDGKFVGFGTTLENLGKKLTPLEKSMLAIAGGVVEFLGVSDGVERIITTLYENEGDWTKEWGVYLASLAEIAGAVAIAEAAFVAVFGAPLGTAFTAVTGFIALIAGIEKAFNNIRLDMFHERLAKVFKTDEGVPFTDMVDAINDSILGLQGGITDTSKKFEDFESAKGIISDLNDEINEISTALETGYGAADEYIPLLIQKYDELADAITNKYAIATAAIVTAIGDGGVVSQGYVAAGNSIDETVETLTKNQGELTDAARETINTIQELSQQKYTAPDLWTNEQQDQLNAALLELGKLQGYADGVTNSLSYLQSTAASTGVNVSDFFTDVGEFKVDEFQNAMGSVVSSAKTVNGALEEEIKNLQAYANGLNMPELAASIGDETRKQSQAILTQQISDTITPSMDLLQKEFVDRAYDIVADANEAWSGMTWLEKQATHASTADVYAYNELTQYIAEVEKMEGELQTTFETLGVNGKTWASNALREIRDGVNGEGGLFSDFVENETGDAMIDSNNTTKKLKENFDQVFEELSNEQYADKMSDITKDMMEGGVKGVDENKEDLVSGFTGAYGEVEEGVRDVTGVHSPSRVYESISQDMVAGAVRGITSKKQEFVSAVEKMATEAADAFKKALQDGINNAVGNLKVPKVSVSSSGGMSGVMQGQMSAASSAVDTSMQEMFTDVLPQYFEAGQWDGLFATLSSTLDIGLEGIAGSFDEWMTGFWNEHLVVWFEDSKLKEGIFTPLETNLTDEWTSLTTWFDTSMNKWWDEDLTPWFAADKWEPQFDTINTAADTGFQKVRRTIGDLLDKITDDVKKSCKKMGDDLKDISDSLRDTKELSNISVTVDAKGAKSYATGGFVEDGYFFANHNELVGRFSNGRTAVANNAQIVAGIQAGVYAAVRDAMNDSGGTQVVIQGDADRIFRVMQNKSRQYNRATGANAFA